MASLLFTIVLLIDISQLVSKWRLKEQISLQGNFQTPILFCYILIPLCFMMHSHASQFNCDAVVVMHLWAGYPPYRNFLQGGHLPSFCTNRKLVQVNFKADSPAPAFSGMRNFSTCIFNINFTGTESFQSMLQAEGSMQGDCLLGGCYSCNISS